MTEAKVIFDDSGCARRVHLAPSVRGRGLSALKRHQISLVRHEDDVKAGLAAVVKTSCPVCGAKDIPVIVKRAGKTTYVDTCAGLRALKERHVDIEAQEAVR